MEKKRIFPIVFTYGLHRAVERLSIHNTHMWNASLGTFQTRRSDAAGKGDTWGNRIGWGRRRRGKAAEEM